MKKSRKSLRTAEEGLSCSSTNQSSSSSNGGTRARFLPRLSLRRLLYNSPLLGSRRLPGLRAPRKNQNRETATKSTSTSEVPLALVESVPIATAQTSSTATQASSTPLPSPTDLPSSSSDTQILALKEKTTPLKLECPLCLAELPYQCFPVLSTCNHRSCYDCLQQYLRVEISESRTSIACPECSERLHPNDVRMILNDKNVYSKYEDFMVRRVLAVDPDTRWCPQPDCGFAVIASGCASCPKLKCQRSGCPGVFCYHCKADWHPNQTCDAARVQRRSLPPIPNLDPASGSAGSTNAAPSLTSPSGGARHSRDSDIKPCPRCSVLIVKMDDGSCNHMTCAVCGAEFCWLCMKEISDLHYLSPSGCTFWGKKPWSRKKKILWQLGTLVGAPVGIGLVAGIALPAMIIGIPVWVGRKLYGRYKHSSKHKRNLVIAGGVTASVLVSPVVAGLVVGIGVPILLFYIYGVVPVSLCRSGGCDVTTSGTGVHFDFDDEEDEEEEEEDSERAGDSTRLSSGRLSHGGGPASAMAGDASSTDAASHRGINPSIGEASLSMDSGSHLEREEEEDEEEVEEGAFSKLHLGGGRAFEHSRLGRGHRSRMEVQADVQATTSSGSTSQQHRLSLCSEETTGSEKSGNTADDGAASTRALAGSVLSYKVTDSSSTSGVRPVLATDATVEVHQSTCVDSVVAPRESQDTSCRDSFLANSSQDIDIGIKQSPRKLEEEPIEISSNWERVRFNDNINVYNETAILSDQSPSPSSSSLKEIAGKRSPSGGSLRGSVSMGRAFRHLLLHGRGSSEKLDCEGQP